MKLASCAQRADRTPSSAPGVAEEDDTASNESEMVEVNDIPDDHGSQMEENPYNEDDDDDDDDEEEGRDEDEEEKDDGDGDSDQADNEDEASSKVVEGGLFGLDATVRAIELMQIGVKEIILTDRTIGDEGAMALGKELGKNTSLLTLGLECNNLGKAGLTALAKALNVNTTLRKLSGDEYALALAKTLAPDAKLATLK
ncbi:Hypothetical Protein FCC1311_067252 [Hondaea fermentalgiana]|uniref:Nucleotide-binding oligomerization domain-containing protein 1 n=1 Tax=Hondaea fermentalgiana TaxID=2315210 RepID=A0A2R5GIS5_9STRA|nr:Hypothetical Protein FCC1311_067252 [Hondaea fermentalgiana]|eukprot:GBG30505.1 Hypothetical Protein FCC1311_067252 [Hondaea fermentalgiana]